MKKIHQANAIEWEAVPLEQQYHLISVLGQMALKQIKHQSAQKEVKNEFILPFIGQQDPTQTLRPLSHRLRSPINNTASRKTFRINQTAVRSG